MAYKGLESAGERWRKGKTVRTARWKCDSSMMGAVQKQKRKSPPGSADIHQVGMKNCGNHMWPRSVQLQGDAMRGVAGHTRRMFEHEGRKEGGRAEFKLLTTAPLNHSQRQALFRGARYGIPVHSTGGVCADGESGRRKFTRPVDFCTVDARSVLLSSN